MNPLVVKPAHIWFLKHTKSVDVGWRIKCKDGFHDVMWGNLKSRANLPMLLADIKDKYGSVPQVIDEAESHFT